MRGAEAGRQRLAGLRRGGASDANDVATQDHLEALAECGNVGAAVALGVESRTAHTRTCTTPAIARPPAPKKERVKEVVAHNTQAGTHTYTRIVRDADALMATRHWLAALQLQFMFHWHTRMLISCYWA